METYYVKYRKNMTNVNSKVFKTKNGRLIMQSKRTESEFKVKICGTTGSKRITKQFRN